ncbi:Hpt domain-containing protein [Butyrivibrio sp. ob235]|uniref:response regulator n=1 Tax=Butyrivibrio sp. ob235 TaxID=1761780 RepID=UPI0008C110CC|nr:response regulator [Butyrivibrio sp. ob235]SEK27211.1 Hpt domain-containing protein [Butyrivibrio sp. ob235]
MDNKVKKISAVYKCVSVLIWIILTSLCVYTSLYGDKFMYVHDDKILFTFYLLPFLLVGGLFGYFFGMISFMIAFVVSIASALTTAYNMSIFLVATLCISIFAQYMFFKNIKKTAIACIATLLITTLIEYACLSVVQVGRYDLSNISHFIDYICRDVYSVIFSVLVVYIILSKAPDFIKIFFPIGIAYTKAYEENKELQKNVRKTKLSVKITAIIIALELILGIAVAVYMMILFPDLKNMFVGGIERREPVHIENTEDMVQEIKDLDFKFDDAALGFDIKMILLMMCVGVPFAAIANFYTKMVIGSPIGRMSDFMYDYANADDDTKLEVGKKVDNLTIKTGDEIQVLHESMQTTVHSIEDYIGRLKAKQELEKELEVAQKASEAKSSFLSNMSHEIRTPINAVLGMNEMILRESDNDRILEYANNVKSAGNSLLGIINDILDFSKIEAGKMDILPVQYHLGSTINDLINMVAVKAEEKGLKLELNIDETLPTVLIGDEIRIKQCVTNVLSNAVKYTEEGSVALNISYRKVDDKTIMLRFQVIDTGIGIKEEDINKLYSPFERIEEIRNRSIEGTGLGMSIVKKLLALMDTRLEVKSVYGEGSDFSFEVRQQVVSWEELGDFKEKYKEYLKTLEKYHEKFKAPEAEILVVDDTPMNLTVVKGLLKTTQIQIDTAESGRETLEKVKNKKYDAIFIDHRMPEMDGLETLAAMKKMEENLSVDAPCIALTANAGAGAREEYMAAGFDDYLSKPIDGGLLEDMLKTYLPSEKLILEEESEDVYDKDENDERQKLYKTIEGIDYEEALKNCGSLDILQNVIEEFHVSIDSKADNIERFAADNDYRNYTVAVHALKSSARLLGAMKLSEDAAYLEKCGNDESTEEIKGKTPELLALYRSYKDKLQPAIEKSEETDLPEIPVDELEGAFSDMKELLEAYDFDTADGIMKMLSDYSIPDDYKDKYNKIVELMAAVDRDALLELL